MLYTTYLAKMRFLPKEMKKYLIVRFPPAGFRPDRYKNFEHVPQLAPSTALLMRYKNKEISWFEFRNEFQLEIQDSTDVSKVIDRIIEELRSGADVAIVCFEKDYRQCHRSLTADYIYNRANGEIDWEEWQLK